MRRGQRPDRASVLLDTSAAVPVCLRDHGGHEAVVRMIGDRSIGLAGHAWFETFSVLTRLPVPQRRNPHDVLILLRQNFPFTVFPSSTDLHSFIEELASIEVSGGAIYDALVGLTARRAAVPLMTGDRRATSTYAHLGIRTEFIDLE